MKKQENTFSRSQSRVHSGHRVEGRKLQQPSNVQGAIVAYPTGQAPMGYFKLLRLATQFPWMFSEPHYGMEMENVWFPVFEELCKSISALLGEERYGFHWNHLTREGCHPYWYFRFGEEMDMYVGTLPSLTGMKVVLINPEVDPENKLRDAITAMVKEAQARAAALSALAPNTAKPHKKNSSGFDGKGEQV
jgi:hypothetical protein